jgi:hypothetical protein
MRLFIKIILFVWMAGINLPASEAPTLSVPKLLGRVGELVAAEKYNEAPVFAALAELQSAGLLSGAERKLIAQEALRGKFKSFRHRDHQIELSGDAPYKAWPEPRPAPLFRVAILTLAELKNLNEEVSDGESVVSLAGISFAAAGDGAGGTVATSFAVVIACRKPLP